MPPPLILRIIGDATSVLKSNEAVISSNTLVGKSAVEMGTLVSEGAQKQLATSLKVLEAQKLQVAEWKQLSAAAAAGSEEQILANVALEKSQAALNRTLGISAVTTRTAGTAAKEGERDFGKLSRGLLAGSGAASALGRSLAFASTGFIAFAAGATLLRGAVKAAQDEAVAQKQVDQQLKVSGKTWDQYGAKIDSALLKESHLAGFTKADLLSSFGFLVRVGGNVSKSLDLVGLAADIARGRGISLQAATLALSKALGGSATALRRLGIIVPKNVTTTQALAYVQGKFAGQAAVSTTATQKLSATFTDASAAIGTQLLPTVIRLSTELSNWLAKMNETGRLTRDTEEAVKIAGTAFHGLEAAIKAVDDVTGSFGHTLLLLGEIWAGLKIAKAITAIRAMATAWGFVESSATAAGAAETEAVAAGSKRVFAVNSAGVATETRTAGAGAAGAGLATGNIVAIATAVALVILQSPQFQRAKESLKDKLGPFGFLVSGPQDVARQFVNSNEFALRTLGILPPKPGQNSPGNLRDALGGSPFTRLPGVAASGAAPPPGSPFGTATPIVVYKAYAETINNQLAEARAALTKGSADDVSVAKRIVARIHHLIDTGHLAGNSLLQALQAEAGAISTIQSAAAAAAQKRAAAAAAAKAAASTYNIPIALQLAQAKLDAYGKDTTKVLHQIIAAAQRAIASGKKNAQGEIAALGVIQQARSQLQQAATTFTLPAKLQLELAKDQALGTDQTGVLKKMKVALERALKKAKGNIALQTDIWNQIYQINQQLGSSAQSAFGDYKQASSQALTRGLGLTPEQRDALRARLSQLGPNGTVPMQGTGAGGYAINPDTGRPIHIHTHVNLDGKRVADNTTKHQQRTRRRNPSQRRGPNAG